jgi:hypothetical protein
MVIFHYTSFTSSHHILAILHASDMGFTNFSCTYQLYFAIVDNGHWVLVCINILHRQVNVLDSMKNAKKNNVYDKAHVLVRATSTMFYIFN